MTTSFWFMGAKLIHSRISTDTLNALCALAYLSERRTVVVSLSEISVHYGLTKDVTLRALRQLSRAQFVRSYRGVRGGYQIVIDLKKTRLSDFLIQMQGEAQLDFPAVPPKNAKKYSDSLNLCLRKSISFSTMFMDSVTVQQILDGYSP